MTDKSLELALVALTRAVPGLINLASLLFLGNQLPSGEFGLYSTSLATAALVASLSFGAIQFSIVSSYAKAAADGHGVAYEATVLAAGAMVALLLALPGAVLAIYDPRFLLGLFVVSSFGILQLLQELLRAKLRFYAYAASALVQSASFMVLLLLTMDASSDHRNPLMLFGISNCIALVVSVAFAKLQLVRPEFSLLQGVRTVGVPYTIGTLAENGLFVGFRYAIIIFGSPVHLGVFSFCVDLAQRTVGFVVNVTGFVFVPRAFERAETVGERSFRQELTAGAVLSGAMAIVVLLAVVLLSQLPLADSLDLSSFNAVVFAILGLAVIINRVKKMRLDPLLMRYSKVSYLIYGYLAGAVVAIPIACAALILDIELLTESAYLIGYLLAAVFVFRQMSRTGPGSVPGTKS